MRFHLYDTVLRFILTEIDGVQGESLFSYGAISVLTEGSEGNILIAFPPHHSRVWVILAIGPMAMRMCASHKVALGLASDLSLDAARSTLWLPRSTT